MKEEIVHRASSQPTRLCVRRACGVGVPVEAFPLPTLAQQHHQFHLIRSIQTLTRAMLEVGPVLSLGHVQEGSLRCP
ncbi:hypothetical protein FOCC_FOCC001832 [Frankliniella occidentalis]|nr:hypothetical protein FOCC_FOCC001832 [Frankliniella occidentalis]